MPAVKHADRVDAQATAGENLRRRLSGAASCGLAGLSLQHLVQGRDEPRDVPAGGRIVNAAAGAARRDQPVEAQPGQLLGYGGLRQVHDGLDLGH